MLTPNYGCVDATYKFACSDTVFTSLVMIFLMLTMSQLSKSPGSVRNCLWGHSHTRSPVINRNSRVSYPGPRFLSSATWPSLPKKHYSGLINQ